MDGARMNFVKRIEELLHERRWTYYRLSQECDVSEGALNNMKARKDIRLSTIEKICDGFKITLPQFFALSNSEPVTLTKEQKHILDLWATLTATEKESILQIIQNYNNSK